MPKSSHRILWKHLQTSGRMSPDLIQKGQGCSIVALFMSARTTICNPKVYYAAWPTVTAGEVMLSGQPVYLLIWPKRVQEHMVETRVPACTQCMYAIQFLLGAGRLILGGRNITGRDCVGMVCSGLAWSGRVWHCRAARHGTARHGTALHSTARHSTARHGMVWYGHLNAWPTA